MAHEIRLVDSGNFPVDPRAYRQGINLYAAQQLMQMANNNQVSEENQLPPSDASSSETEATTHIVKLFPRTRLDSWPE